MWARSVRSSSAARSPRGDRPSRASDSAVDRALAEAGGARWAKSSSAGDLPADPAVRAQHY